MLEQIKYLQEVLAKLRGVNSLEGKIEILNEQPTVYEFFPLIQPFFRELSFPEEFAIKSLLVIQQGPILFKNLDCLRDVNSRLKRFMEVLLRLENDYHSLGGIIGYHLTILKFIVRKKQPPLQSHEVHYRKPKGRDISSSSPLTRNYVEWGIDALPLIGEIYPVGGAGDRLGLVDKKTGKPLPAAKLKFLGRSLLEGLFRDLQAREYLYHQATGKRILTPVALMTSHEKNNHEQIYELCENENWFGRPKESIRFFTQALVPVVTVTGYWSTSAPLELTLKPGGHGFLWQLALEAGIFDWMEAQKKEKLLIRQINNPIGGIDAGLLAFLGIGCHENKAFGFASCPRLLNAPEGMNVLVERKMGNQYEYCLTNVEYTEFSQTGIPDIPETPESRYSVFPSNTNLLFADIAKMRVAIERCPIPGLLINMKNTCPLIDEQGLLLQVEGGRLESTMQNIADVIVTSFPSPLNPEDYDHVPSYITFNARQKTISVTKKLYEEGKDSLGTPEECLYDLLKNYEELFLNYCQFKIPCLGDKEDYLKNGPSFYILLHPALGPPFDVIAQKIRQGSIGKRSELQLEIADVDIHNLCLRGSLRVFGQNLMGKKTEQGEILYGKETSKCILRHVKIQNAGIDFTAPNCYWANELRRSEELLIEILGNGEFIAENVQFHGQHHILVPSGHRIVAFQEGEKIHFKKERI